MMYKSIIFYVQTYLSDTIQVIDIIFYNVYASAWTVECLSRDFFLPGQMINHVMQKYWFAQAAAA